MKQRPAPSHRRWSICLVAILALSSAAHGSGEQCLLLFSNQPSLRDKNASAHDDWAGLNDETREYLTRLHYLVDERHLLIKDVYQAVADAAEPINPLGASARSAQFFPHYTAFAQLLKADLQWPEIRQAMNGFINAGAEDKKRATVAVKETTDVLVPTPVKVLTFGIDRFVQTADSQVLALDILKNNATKVLTVKAYDLSSGKEVSSTEIAPQSDLISLDVAATKEGAFAAFTSRTANKLMVIDLLTGRLGANTQVKEKGMGWGSFFGFFQDSGSLFGAHLVEREGQMAVVTFRGNKVLFLDPSNGEQLDSVAFTENKNFEPVKSGTVGNSVFVTGHSGSTYLIDPNGKEAIQKTDAISASSVISYHGKVLALGAVPRAENDHSLDEVWKTIELGTGQASAPFTIAKGHREVPRVLGTFERDDTLYGLISTNSEVYVVDLIKGEIKTSLSQTPDGAKMFAFWSPDVAGHLLFTHKGNVYLPAIRYEGDQSSTKHLVYLDALTLLPAGYDLYLDRDFVSLRVVPATAGKVPQAVLINPFGSQLISFVLRPD